MPTPDQRAVVVRKDLDNVIHPIVPHKQLEQQQLVIVSAKDSTVVDADGREYLDGMAGLWCVNIGYGRTELADVAAEQMRKLSYYPHTAMNAARRRAGREGQRAARRRQPRLLRQLGLGGQRGRVQVRAPVRRATSTRSRTATRRSAGTTATTARRWPRWPRAAWATAR